MPLAPTTTIPTIFVYCGLCHSLKGRTQSESGNQTLHLGSVGKNRGCGQCENVAMCKTLGKASHPEPLSEAFIESTGLALNRNDRSLFMLLSLDAKKSRSN